MTREGGVCKFNPDFQNTDLVERQNNPVYNPDFQNTDLVERQSNPEVEAAAVAASSALEENKQQLQGKLRELQDKKHKMDSLLQELNSLRDQRSEVMMQLNNASANNAQGTIKTILCLTERFQ